MDREEMNRYLEEGIDDYLIKPFREATMFNKLCQVLEVDIKLIHQDDMKIVLKEEPGSALYNLEELRAITRGNPDFYNEMIQTFIDNAREGIRQIREAFDQGEWKVIRETSHRLIPSYKHLSIRAVVSDLIELKSRAEEGAQPDRMGLMIERIDKETSRVIKSLVREINTT
jgi:HPt (histidine-containing phosphotransfer) domain-containing protein